MLLINPPVVIFNNIRYAGVTQVAVSRFASKGFAHWTDVGPYAALADVPEQALTATLRQELTAETLEGPRPGEMGTLVIFTGPTAGDSGRKKVSAQGVVSSVRVDLRPPSRSSRASEGVATRTIQLTLLSSDGAAEPVAVTDAGGEA